MSTSVIKILSLLISTRLTTCTISGLTYMDSLKPLPGKEMDPCNPLYWYPRAIPQHCYIKTTPNPPKLPGPPSGVVPIPVPVPIPQPFPPVAPGPFPAAPMPMMPPIMPPIPQQIPFGLPLISSNPMLPIGGLSYPPPSPYLPPPAAYPNYSYGRNQNIGMVPGISGLVSDDGGINILPFSDAYSDMLEKHKNKLLRKKMHKLFRDFENYPRIKGRRQHRKIIY